MSVVTGPLLEEQLSGQVLDHLGLIASVIDELKLVEKIDKALPVSLSKGAR